MNVLKARQMAREAQDKVQAAKNCPYCNQRINEILEHQKKEHKD